MSFNNQFKTAVLLALLTALSLWVGSLFGRTGLYFAIIFVGGMSFLSYFYSDKIVLKMYRAKEVDEKSAPRLYNICKDLSQKTNMPMPKVYIVPDKNANAFATGRSKKHSAVAATQGLLNILNDRELKGVLAHEFAHIKNRDILISTVVGMFAGVISYVGTMAQWSFIFGGFGDNDDRGGSMLKLLTLAIITPLIATLIKLSISRNREYLADSTGAKFIKDGDSLADALEALEKDSKNNSMRIGNQATAHLFIVNPFSAKNFIKLLSTHPSTEERAKRLRSMDFSK